jgi:mRNA interferase HigB
MMAMAVLNTRTLNQFVRKHRDAAASIERWMELVQSAEWSSIVDVRKVFPNADGVPVKITGGRTLIVTVFNIKGNDYRLITVLDFAAATVIVRDVLTHAEYSKETWKDRQ